MCSNSLDYMWFFLFIIKLKKDWKVTSLSNHSSSSANDFIGVVLFTISNNFCILSKVFIWMEKKNRVNLSMYDIKTYEVICEKRMCNKKW